MLNILRLVTPKCEEVPHDVIIDYFYDMNVDDKMIEIKDVRGYISDEEGKLQSKHINNMVKNIMMVTIINNVPPEIFLNKTK